MSKKVSKPKKTQLVVKDAKPKSISQIISEYKPSKADVDLRKSIKLKINAHLKKNSTGKIIDFSNWYCGITKQSIIARISQHEKARNFIAFFPFSENADHVSNSHDIEVHFHNKGAINDKRLGNATKDSTYVYIFKENPTILDILKDIFNS